MRSTVLFSLILLLTSGFCSAQNHSRQAIYVEGLGTGIAYSINYDRIFYTKQATSLAYRVGFTTFPLDKFRPGLIGELNMLRGASNHHLEVGFGTLLYGIDRSETTLASRRQWIQLQPTAVPRIGYRYQKAQGGLLFRLGFTPIIQFNSWEYDHSTSIHLWVGVSLGKSF